VRQLLLLKSRLKMKPINHQVLIMVFLQKYWTIRK
jgi:hypothetical protein